MGKTSVQETATGVDPSLRQESAALANLFRSFAGSAPHQFYDQPTVAAFTPKQQSAFSMGDAAASAFGMQSPAHNNYAGQSSMPASGEGKPASGGGGRSASGLPTPEMSASGVMGYNTTPQARAAVGATDPAYQSAMSQLFSPEGLGKQYEDRGNPQVSGGKK